MTLSGKTTTEKPNIRAEADMETETQAYININSLPVSQFIKSLIKNGNKEQYPSRSEADMAVITALVNACVAEESIKQIFQKFPIGEKYRQHNAP